MSDELERKRQERIANFKLNFRDDDDSAGTEISSKAPSVSSDGADAEQGAPVSLQKEEAGEGAELNSYSAVPADAEIAVDKKSLKRAKRIDKRRRKQKAKKNRVVFRLVWIAMALLVSVMIGEFIMVGVNDMLGVGREEDRKVSVTIPQNVDLDTFTDILYVREDVLFKGMKRLFFIL